MSASGRFVVCDALGLDTGNYSFPYVARWAGGSDELIKDTTGRVIECAKSILGCLEVASQDDEELKETS